MLIDFELEVKLRGFHITGVLELGAHLAEERDCFYNLGIRHIWWVEGNPELEPALRENLKKYQHNKIVIALIGESDDELRTFHISNHESLSSSVFELGTHKKTSPDTIYEYNIELPTKTVDSLDRLYNMKEVNTLIMDLQGSELQALRGAKEFLKQIDYIYTEISCEAVYVGGAQVEDLTKYLVERGFKPVLIHWATVGGDNVGAGWGDGLFVREGV